MATQNHVTVANFAPASSTAQFNTIWKLSRAMQKAGWRYLASGDGSAKDTSADPELNKWGSGTVTNAGAGAASIGAPSRGRSTITGLTGIVAADKGRYLKISGAATGANNHWHRIEEIVSSTSVKINAITFAVASDANNGALTWDVRDALGTAYPSALDSVQAWILLEGPSTIKIPITSAPTPGASGLTFVRGENIVQASTGFEGEILGYVFDSGAGYLVVLPRLRGTGGGIFGLTTANAFTGAVSGATVTQNGTALEYRHEMVFWKQNNTSQGTIFWQSYEPVGESASGFVTLSAAAGCTSTIAPGGGGTGNAFPSIGLVMLGNTTDTANIRWESLSSFVSGYGNAQIVCADAIPETGWSPDGSWVWALANTNSAGNGGAYAGLMFQRLDDTEDGDLDPYVSCSPDATTLYTSSSRTVTVVVGTVTEFFSGSTLWNSTANTMVRGWRGRGVSGVDAFQAFELSGERTFASATGTPAGAISASNPSDNERVATALVSTRVREPVGAVSIQVTKKMRKGKMRWVSWIMGGNGNDTYDTKKLVQLSPNTPNMVVGPWDGSSTPVSA